MLIFSDVDGTLLDASGRCPLPGKVLSEIASRHRVVLASSRHTEELRQVQAQLGLAGPVIAEDGAVIADPDAGTTTLGVARDELVARMAEAVGRSGTSALLAMEPDDQQPRLASILLPASIADESLKERLARSGLALTVGGNWATVTSGSDKGRAAVRLAAAADVEHWMAIGDSGNDAPLLRAATAGYVISHDGRHHPTLRRIPGVTLLTADGPFGWIEMLKLAGASTRQGD